MFWLSLYVYSFAVNAQSLMTIGTLSFLFAFEKTMASKL